MIRAQVRVRVRVRVKGFDVRGLPEEESKLLAKRSWKWFKTEELIHSLDMAK